MDIDKQTAGLISINRLTAVQIQVDTESQTGIDRHTDDWTTIDILQLYSYGWTY